ncbi:MAG: Type-4 uracil-DNA glycosylase [Anaerolineales bacterium]|nr:Type-4 uracil-DNA glycosylase [Anaerolineales bacterium]
MAEQVDYDALREAEEYGFETLDRLEAAVQDCPLCRLSHARTNAVPGEGPTDAEIMFVGEGPGFHEDRQGRPFVGAAGKYLEELLESIGLTRDDVYITNVVKCRPPENRDPRSDEVEACRPYLDRQIKLMDRKMVITLGRHSMNLFLSEEAKISQVHGRPRKIGGIVYYPVYHPAAGLHQPRWKSIIEEDFERILEVLAQAPQMRDEEPPEDAEQLSLF